MDATKLLSDILANSVKMSILNGVMDEYTDYSEEEKKTIIRTAEDKFSDKLYRAVNDLSNKDIHKPTDGTSLRS